MIYYIYLTDKSIVKASIYDDDDDIFLGGMDLLPEDLETILNFCQNAVDATILQLAEKANNLFNKKVKPSDIN